MALSLRRVISSLFLHPPQPPSLSVQNFRSDAALETLAKASEAKTANLVLYNYPSLSGAFSALFAHLYHFRLQLPCLVLPFSSVAPFRVDDVCVEGLERCYLLDFLGPKGFALELSRKVQCEVIAFDHRKIALSKVPPMDEIDGKLRLHVNLDKCSSIAVYEYFSSKLAETGHNVDNKGLLNPVDQDRVERLLKFIEDGDLRKWALPEIRAFNVGIREWRSKLNCITNAHMFEQLKEINAVDVIGKGNSHTSVRLSDAKKLLDKAFKVRLGQGLYGECLGVRADGNSDLSDEIGEELCRKSSEAGLRPIGAVIYMQRKNLKMCLRSTDSRTDVSEVAKAYGGGGSPRSSSFIIRMDEYNKWLSMHS